MNVIWGCDSYPAGRFILSLFALNRNKNTDRLSLCQCSPCIMSNNSSTATLSLSGWFQEKQICLKEWSLKPGKMKWNQFLQDTVCFCPFSADSKPGQFKENRQFDPFCCSCQDFCFDAIICGLQWYLWKIYHFKSKETRRTYLKMKTL